VVLTPSEKNGVLLLLRPDDLENKRVPDFPVVSENISNRGCDHHRGIKCTLHLRNPCQWPDTDIFYKIKKVRNAQMARIFQGLPSKFFPQLKETIFVD
jgi:hypothetical protein